MKHSDITASIINDARQQQRFEKYFPAIFVGVFLGMSTAAFALGGRFKLSLENVLASWPFLAVVVLSFTMVIASVFWINNRRAARVLRGSAFLILTFSAHIASSHAMPFQMSVLKKDIGCLTQGLSFGLLIATFYIFLQQRLKFIPAGKVRIGFIVSSSLGALLFQTFHCPYLNIGHLVVCHLGNAFILNSLFSVIENRLTERWIRQTKKNLQR